MHIHVCPHCVAQTLELTLPYAGSYWTRLKLWWVSRKQPHTQPLSLEISR